MNFLRKIFDTEYKEMSKFEKIADEIEALDSKMQKLKDSDFKKKTEQARFCLADFRKIS